MARWSMSFAVLALVAWGLAAGQDILAALKQQDGMTRFAELLGQFDDLVSSLNQGSFTVLAPNDEAMAKFLATKSNFTSDEAAVEALLQYHVAKGTLPSAKFDQPSLAPTLLDNPLYANVTGGQVVLMTTDNDRPVLVSGVKAMAHVVQPDTIYTGGLIHILDSVLSIPVSFTETVSQAGLSTLFSLWINVKIHNTSSPASIILNTFSDLTVFGCNNSYFISDYYQWDQLDDATLLSIFKYSVSQGKVPYSTEFQNDTKIPTLNNMSATISRYYSDLTYTNDWYVDDSNITAMDYITSNGVLHLVDKPMNPNRTGIRPWSNAIYWEDASHGLSSAAYAGIGTSVAAVVLGGGLVAAWYIRRRRRARVALANSGSRDGASSDQFIPQLHADGRPPTYELDPKNKPMAELGRNSVPPNVYELPYEQKPLHPSEIDGTESNKASVGDSSPQHSELHPHL